MHYDKMGHATYFTHRFISLLFVRGLSDIA